jgi:hypothetical protein
MTSQLEIQTGQLTTATQQAKTAATTISGARQAANAALPSNAFGISAHRYSCRSTPSPKPPLTPSWTLQPAHSNAPQPD